MSRGRPSQGDRIDGLDAAISVLRSEVAALAGQVQQMAERLGEGHEQGSTGSPHILERTPANRRTGIFFTGHWTAGLPITTRDPTKARVYPSRSAATTARDAVRELAGFTPFLARSIGDVRLATGEGACESGSHLAGGTVSSPPNGSPFSATAPVTPARR